MRKPFHKSLLITLSVSGFLLSGCGGSDSPDMTVTEPPTPPPFQFTNSDFSGFASMTDIVEPGVYAYRPLTVNQDGGLFPKDGLVLISDTGRIVFADQESLGFARVQMMNGSLVATDFTYVTDSPAGEGVLGQPTVDIVEQTLRARPDPLTPAPEILSGTVEDEAGQLVESYQVQQGQANEDVSLAEIADTYRFNRPDNGATTFEITSDGAVIGSDTSGCSWSGILFLPSDSSQIMEGELTAENCGSSKTATGPTRDGRYVTLGFYDSTQEIISLYLLSDDYATRFVARSDSYVPPVIPEPFKFVSDNNEIEPSVTSKLTPGVFDVSMKKLDADGKFEAPVTAKAYLSSTGRMFVNHPEFNLFTRIKVNNTNNFSASAALAGEPGYSYDAVDKIFRGVPDIQGSVESREGELLYRYSMTPNPIAGGTVVTLPTIAGMYSETTPNGITTNFVIDDTGELTGSDTTGCFFDGRLLLPDPTDNAKSVVEVAFTAYGCGATPDIKADARNGKFNGVGYYQPDLDSLTFGYANSHTTGLFDSK